MNISVFGVGYVGSVLAACTARNGHRVIGVDTDRSKVRLLNAGVSPIAEPGLGQLISAAVQKGLLSATLDAEDAVRRSELSFICVGTPGRKDGSPNLEYVRAAAQQVGSALRTRPDFHVIVARSTMLPGTMRSVIIPIIEQASGKRAGVDFGACVNPEFLREGTAVHDFDHPPKIVIGAMDKRSTAALTALYAGLHAPLVSTEIEVAEAIKYADNAWHALKIDFANEIGAVCDAAGVDSQALMDIFAMDEKLNISRRYLRPGLAFGGSCLPKDVRGLVRFAQNAGIEIPVLESVLPSNDRHAERCVRLIEGKGNRRVGVLGITFKANTDDLRESPMVRIVERLDTDGYDVRVFDANLKAPVNGASVELRRLRNLLVTDVDEVLRHAETLVISNSDKVYRDLVSRIPSNVCVVDFAHMCGTRVTRDGPEEHDDRLPRDHILMHGSEPAGEYRFGENYHRT